MAYYDGKDGRPHFADHAVGTGPYRLALYEKQYRFTLERNEPWYGSLPANRDAPGAVFPGEHRRPRTSPRAGSMPSYAGRRMPFLDRIKFYREKENIPRFNKFLQGYYDDGGIIKESFDAVVQGGRLSPEMQARGMRLDKEVEPTIFYVGFNMEDPVLGDAGRRARPQAAPGHERRRRCQAIPRALPQRPRPAGADAAAAGHLRLRRRLQEPLSPVRRCPRAPAARRGRLQERHRPGHQHAPQAQLRHVRDHGVGGPAVGVPGRAPGARSAWTSRSTATTYNQFQDKVRRGAYQIFIWGWLADFPDPENFFFLLECQNARSKSGGPNTADFCDAEFDRLYHEMKYRPNDEHRADLIRRMLAILERERPWIELYHREDFVLSHAWLVNSKPMGISYPAYKYKDVRPEMRARLRAEWNAPVRWPLYLVLIVVVAVTVPAVRTYYRERL